MIVRLCQRLVTLAFEIDAEVSLANTAGIMNGGYDADLRNYLVSR